jgi:deoxyribodipyrimidine photo-lyase
MASFGIESNMTNGTTKPDALPEFLRAHAANPRVTVRRGGEPLADGKCVVYWMQRAQRGVDNPAVDLAITIGNELELPVIAFFSAI